MGGSVVGLSVQKESRFDQRQLRTGFAATPSFTSIIDGSSKVDFWLLAFDFVC
eukprot:m.90304 g.90304  ORF g.90304 m.90304 type:complete len:53 (-) comp26383_c0_seq2:88-246(-)